MKRNKYFKIGLLISLLPFIIGAIFYKSLPDVMPTHFDINGNPDGFSSKTFALFGLPAIMLGIYIITYVFINLDPRKNFQGDRVVNFTLLFLPILSVIISVITILFAKGEKIDVSNIVLAIVALSLIGIGNYLPKTKRNYTVGIKLPWTLEYDYVWDKTHALAGKLWTVGGILAFIAAFVLPIATLPIILAVTIIPCIYSYLIYKKIKENK